MPELIKNIACEEQIYINPNNADIISIFSACLRDTNATKRILSFRSNHLTSVYIL